MFICVRGCGVDVGLLCGLFAGFVVLVVVGWFGLLVCVVG